MCIYIYRNLGLTYFRVLHMINLTMYQNNHKQNPATIACRSNTDHSSGDHFEHFVDFFNRNRNKVQKRHQLDIAGVTSFM